MTPRRVMFSPTDANRLLVIDLSGLVGLWDIADVASPELTTSFPASAIEATFTPDGASVLTVGFDGRVRSWGLEGSLNWTTPSGHTGPARAVAGGGDTVVSGGEDGTIRFWRLSDGSPIGEPIAAHEGPVMSLALSSQGHVATVGADDALRLWEKSGDTKWQSRVLFQGPRQRPLGTFMNELRLDVHCGFDRSIAFSPKGDLVAAAVYDGAVRMYALDGTAKWVVENAHSRRNVRGIAFSPHGDVVASAGWDSTVRLWNLDGTPHGNPVDAHYDSAFSVSFSIQGDRMASAGLDNRVRFWTLAGLAAGELPAPRKDRVSAIALAPHSPIMAVADQSGVIRLWNLDGTARGMPMTGHKGAVLDVEFSAKGDQLASGGSDKTLRVWNLDGSPRGTYPPHGDKVASVAFSPGGDLIVSGSDQLRGWRANRVAFSVPNGGWDWTTAIEFTASGDKIFTGTRLGRLQILNPDGSVQTEPLKLKRELIVALAVSPDGKTFATVGGGENLVRLWDASLNPIGTPLEGGGGAVRALAFSPTNTIVVAGGDDGVARIWKLPGGEAETLLVGTPINQMGFWGGLMWVRTDGESVLFYDRSRQLVATTLLRRDAILTFTPDGWYAGPQRAERAMRVFRLSGQRMTAAEIAKRASPEQIRVALSR